MKIIRDAGRTILFNRNKILPNKLISIKSHLKNGNKFNQRIKIIKFPLENDYN